MAAEHELEAHVARRNQPMNRVKERLRYLTALKLHRSYRRVLLDKNGELSADAEAMIADLVGAAGMGTARLGFTGDELQFREGQRSIVLHLLGRIDLRNIATLSKKLRETDQ